MSNLVRTFIACILVLIGISVWSAIAPSHLNWGTHFFAFYSLPVQIGFLLISLLLLIPVVTAKVIGVIETIVQRASKIPYKILFALASVLFVALWLCYPSKIHLLGDGAILLRSIPGVEHLNLPVGFRNQPLVWMLYRGGKALLSVFTVPTPRDVYYLIDVASGIALVGLIFWWMGKLDRPKIEKALLGSLVLFCGGFQFFFGYVENYAAQYVFTVAFAATGWLALEKKIHISVPAIIFVIIIGLNLGSLVFIPALAYVFVHIMSKHKLRAVAIIGAGGIAGVIFLSVSGFNLWLFIEHFLNGSPDFLPLLSAQSGYFPYPMFSLLHLIDWLNAQLLVVPLGLIVPILIFVFYRKEIEWKNPVLIFLLVTTGCGLVFTCVVNSALGVARDWDLFASFFVPLIVLNVYLLQVPFKMEGRKTVMALAAAITLLHLVPFIGINGIANKHLARIEMLNDTRLLSVTSRMFYYESLANYYFDRGDYEKAKEHYEQFVQYDSANPRVLSNLAEVYGKLGLKDASFRTLLRSAALGNPNPLIFASLGVEYANRKDTAKAIEMNLKCLSLDSTQAVANTNLAILYFNTNNPMMAVRYASNALTLGEDNPALFHLQAKAYVRMNNYPKALEMYDQYLALVPGDTYVRSLRDRMKADLSQKKN
jgi:Tfp pilus assembly protein PilF